MSTRSVNFGADERPRAPKRESATEPAVTALLRALSMHGPAQRNTVQKIESKPEVGIEGDLLANTVTIVIRQTYRGPQDE